MATMANIIDMTDMVDMIDMTEPWFKWLVKKVYISAKNKARRWAFTELLRWMNLKIGALIFYIRIIPNIGILPLCLFNHLTKNYLIPGPITYIGRGAEPGLQ